LKILEVIVLPAESRGQGVTLSQWAGGTHAMAPPRFDLAEIPHGARWVIKPIRDHPSR
jgi:hypothetical protein